jgi:hypothetical protein
MRRLIPDFYLTSSDSDTFEEPRKCFQIKRLCSETRDDLMLIRIDPPLIGQPYGLGGEDIYKMIIVTRHQGETLYPIKRWPVFVHVFRILSGDLEARDVIKNKDLKSIAWAELHESEEAAIKKDLNIRSAKT